MNDQLCPISNAHVVSFPSTSNIEMAGDAGNPKQNPVC